MIEINPAPTLFKPRLARCPHCRIAVPALEWITSQSPAGIHLLPTADGDRRMWTIAWCRNCGNIITFRAAGHENFPDCVIGAMFPPVAEPAEDLPPSARRYLQQAMDSIAAPDAAVIMANSAVDAMLKAKGYTEGKLFHRINKARDDGLLTPEMADWAHEVRLTSNDTRHADEENPHATPEQARQIVEFAEALGEFLFVLPARIKRARAGGGKA